MKRALLGLFVGCMTVGLASVAFAGANKDAGISLHITGAAKKITDCVADAPSFHGNGGRDIKPWTTACQAGKTGDFDVWVLVCNGSDSLGVAGVEFGIEYDGASGSGVDVRRWTACADLDFKIGNWPASGGGMIATWVAPENCQNQPAEFHGSGGGAPADNGKVGVPGSVIAVAGVLRVNVFGVDKMQVVPNPGIGRMKIADCLAAEDDITNAVVPRGGIATFCSRFEGYNFCAAGALPAEQTTTWGNIKTLYRQ